MRYFTLRLVMTPVPPTGFEDNGSSICSLKEQPWAPLLHPVMSVYLWEKIDGCFPPLDWDD